MKMMIIGYLLFGANIYGQTQPLNNSAQGPLYDQAGRLIHYGYADGTTEDYSYDPSWRMTKFVDRRSGVTTFVYRADGSMSVVNPDGSIQNR
jgi:YD repeat-containing protein